PQATVLRRAGLDPVVAHRDARAEPLQRLREAYVALDASGADALDAHRTATDRAGGEEVRRRRGVALDEKDAGTRVARATGHDEALPALAPHLDAEARHQRQPALDEGLGAQPADDLERRLLSGHRLHHHTHGPAHAGAVVTHS